MKWYTKLRRWTWELPPEFTGCNSLATYEKNKTENL